MTSPYPQAAQPAPDRPAQKHAGFASTAMVLGPLSFLLSLIPVIPVISLFVAGLAVVGSILSLPPLLARENQGQKARKFAAVALGSSISAVIITLVMYGGAAGKLGSSVNNGTVSDTAYPIVRQV